jgi:hypothetical protein
VDAVVWVEDLLASFAFLFVLGFIFLFDPIPCYAGDPPPTAAIEASYNPKR